MFKIFMAILNRRKSLFHVKRSLPKGALSDTKAEDRRLEEYRKQAHIVEQIGTAAERTQARREHQSYSGR
jgi:hypothetical protein